MNKGKGSKNKPQTISDKTSRADFFLDGAAVKLTDEAKFFLAAIVESSNDSIVTIDLDGGIISWNRAAERLYGYPAREAIGKSLMMLALPEDLAEVFGRIEEIKQSRKVEIYDTVRVSQNGQQMILEIVTSPVKDAQDRIIGVSTIARDVTERRKAEEAVRESEKRLQALVENLPGGAVFIVDKDLRYLVAEGEAVADAGFASADLIGKTIFEALPTEMAVDYEPRFRAGLAGAAFEHEHRTHDRTFISRGVPLKNENGEIYAVLAISYDISKRKRADEALRKSEERLRLLIESAEDYAIFTMTRDGIIDSWNTGAEKIFGWTETEAVGQSVKIIFTPEDRKKGAPEREMKTALRKGRAPDECFHLRKDESRFYVSGVMTLLKDANGKPGGFVKIARDMTEQIKAEKDLRDKEMLQKLVGAQEDERQRIARDLHDELGQQLTALRLNLEKARRMCRDEVICAEIDKIDVLAKSIDNGVDFLAWELRPAALDQFGLISALKNYVRQWTRYSGVSAEFLASSLKRKRFAREVETNLYRIAQEAMNNISKHAGAKSVEVMLEKRGDLIVLIIQDDGGGFNVKAKKKCSKGIGLIGMQERAELIKGTLEIESTADGTTVFVRVPLSFAEKRGSNGK
jgi:PAS domain S-box-containing protein